MWHKYFVVYRRENKYAKHIGDQLSSNKSEG